MKKNYLSKKLVTAIFTVIVSNAVAQNTVTTLGPPVVTMDTNAVCAGSVIDVNFYSTGTYILNTYQLQLSDANGNFVSPTAPNAVIIGSLTPPIGNVTYDPMNPTPGYPPPGTVEGLIPDSVSAGCNYRLRVIATGPAVGPSPVIGTDWGPFCVQHCDIITNSEQDIGMCLYPDTSVCANVSFNVHFYNNNVVYLPGNQFKVQLISRGPVPPPFTQVGPLGALGTVTAANDGTLSLCISYSNLAANGIAPGKYYMRIVATNSSLGADSSFGSMIRVTIGVPSSTPTTIHAVDWNTFQPVDTICTGDLVYFYLTPPPNSNSTYYWYSAQMQGSPMIQNVLLVDFTNFSGNFSIYVSENSFGCFGPASALLTLYVRPLPNVTISAPALVCVGDTIQYTVPFASGTYWAWSLSTGIGTITDSINNVVSVVFNSPGVDTLFCQALNSCNAGLGFRRITVRDYPLIAVLLDTTVCSGSPVTLIASSNINYFYQWRNGTSIISTNDSIIVSPTSTTIYTLSVSNGGICYSYDTVQINMYPFPPVPTITQNGDSLICSVTSGVTYQWFLNGIPQTQATQYIIITPADSGSWYVVVTDVDSPFCSATSATLQIPVGIIEIVYSDYLSVSPNPVADELSITGYQLSGKAEVNIYNTLGEKIFSKEITPGEKEIKINVKNFPAGIYVMRIESRNTNLSGKFVKQ